MGKKRKASAAATEEPSNIGFEAQGPKLNIRSYEDVADSEDEFLLQRDKILLDEGPKAKRRRKIREDEALLEASDEEVLGLPNSEHSEDDISISDDEDEEDEAPLQTRTARQRGDYEDKKKADEGEDEDEGWGDTRDAYHGADAIDTEQAALEEEAEAKRLQQKQLQSMNEADFEFDDDFDKAHPNEMMDGMEEDIVTETLPELQVTHDMGQEERLQLLRQRYPEFEPLANEFLELQSRVEEAKEQARKAREAVVLRRTVMPDSSGLHPAILTYQALATNLGVLAMYFAVLTSTADESGNAIAKAPVELRDHAIMDNILKSRQLWVSVKHLEYPDIDHEIRTLNARIAAEKEAAELKATEAEIVSSTMTQLPKRKKKSKSQREAEAATAEAEARRAERMRKLEADLASLSNLPTAKSKPASKAIRKVASKGVLPSAAEEDSDFGDEVQLTPRELVKKAQRKKTLRFYTSQITQKANKRGAAGRDTGGDMDIPHRERFRERQAKAIDEAERRGKRTDQKVALGNGDDTMAQGKEDDDEDYYDMVATLSKQRKADKAAAAQAYTQAQKEGGRVIEEETIGEDGKRKVTYAIEKNKGLTPFRKKEVRNPRVKKRMKYKEKQKKLGSVRQVYKGGEGKGGYGGELTGIKSGLVKSVKL